jgi:hypothetical protein
VTACHGNTACAGYFLTKIFHPNVSKGGEICVNVLKRDWAPDMGLRHVLLVVRCLLIEPFPESALNEEAGKLLLEDYADFAKHARLMTSIHAQHPKRYCPIQKYWIVQGRACGGCLGMSVPPLGSMLQRPPGFA